MVASIHAESFELEFGDRYVRIALLGLQTLRSIDAVYSALLESHHYREGLNLIWDLREAELFGLSDWDWALLTSRLARAPVAKRRARMVWVLPRLCDDALEGKVRRLMSKLKMVDWRFASELEGAVSWASTDE
ncbi:MAG: hypothetical protein SFV15_07515 [Polyangiaceae bacterium]|nr:hypothetical protein [Polyangiaceae bacterium]